MEQFVLDSGALIALERADRRMAALLARVRAGQARLIIPDAVVAQVWRGGAGRQARVAALLGLKPEQCTLVPLDTPTAKRVGVKAGQSGHADVVDIHVALLTLDRDAALLTSDRGDLHKVDPDLSSRIVDI